ncbi:MAG: C40 family peptidase [Gammaproteobacteria bacterium]|nr:C40 family peptidase [Gammaproteobacteria bacterium]MDH3410879.1 C40 family peptidase [Gammaproteobacteria bacterium]
MQLVDQMSPPTRLITRVRHSYVRLTATLLIGLLAGCGSSEVYQAPVEHRGVFVESQPTPQAATHQQVPAAPRADEYKPNYHMAMVAKEMVGVRYRYGGSSPSSGFDCSGLIHYSYKRIGLRSPRTTTGLYQHARPVHRSEIRTGDLLFFRLEGKKVSHAGIYLGNNRFVHAPSSGKRVSYAQLSSPYWRNRLIRAGRLY